jgi:hypothetical protein
MSFWRGNQQGGQYEDAEDKWQPALSYRHFSLPQFSSGLALHCRLSRVFGEAFRFGALRL